MKTTSPLIAIQFMSDATDEEDARRILGTLFTQDGFLGGRMLPPVAESVRPSWRVQTFHDATGLPTYDVELPEGMRRVCIPPSLLAAVGITDLPAGA